ncbi:hypothetical protein T12_16182 [Trichinella patagoniensis]|uniref:Uncharacterized protein n=1 Tax=Trichinella patagoniensis TaxID=990121 RepID=A0A0V0Z0N7_9BILA|nr:hypothetical protein T12_10062 [Trichinella patagoniensis]KRY06003.1 hypothetical protein T12_16182 [Trichinella patagoniensis]
MTNNIHFASSIIDDGIYSSYHGWTRYYSVLPCSHWEPICLPLLQ